MAMRSSIFSSDTLQGLPRPTAAAVLTVVVLVAARMALLAWSDALFTVSESSTQDNFLHAEARYITSRVHQPVVVFMGTSRFVRMPAKQFARRLGLPENSVGNFSIFGNNFWATHTFFRRNPNVLDHTELVVMDIMPFQLFVCQPFPENDDLFLTLSTAEERLRVRYADRRLLALADLFVFPAWSERRIPGTWANGLRQLSKDRTARYASFLEDMNREISNQFRTGPKVRPTPEQLEAWTLALARRLAPLPVVSEVQTHAFRDLLDGLPTGCRLFLFWVPVRSDYAALMQSDPVCSESFRVFADFIRSIDDPRVTVVWHLETGEMGLADSDYLDVVHFASTKFEPVLSAMSDDIREAGIALSAGGAGGR
jgi:hypothetical protein